MTPCGGYLVKGKHTIGGWGLVSCKLSFDHSFDQLPQRGRRRYATHHHDQRKRRHGAVVVH